MLMETLGSMHKHSCYGNNADFAEGYSLLKIKAGKPMRSGRLGKRW